MPLLCTCPSVHLFLWVCTYSYCAHTLLCARPHPVHCVERPAHRCTHARSTHTTHRVPHAPCTHTRAHELTHTLPCSRRRHAGHRLILQPGWDPGTKVPSKSRKALARGWGFPSGPKAAAGRPGQGPARRSFKGAGAARGAGTPVGPFPARPEARASDCRRVSMARRPLLTPGPWGTHPRAQHNSGRWWTLTLRQPRGPPTCGAQAETCPRRTEGAPGARHASAQADPPGCQTWPPRG